MLKKLLSLVIPQNEEQQDAIVYRNMLRDAAKIGGTVFGPIPAGHRREFFCLDEHTWVWHEEWLDEKNTRQVRTTRYDVRPHGIFKVQDGQPYKPISADEANRLYLAAQEYRNRMHEKFDPLLATAGV